MRSPAAHPLRLFAFLCLAVAIPTVAFADTIYLKNGRKITADRVVQENGQIRYETAEGTLSLPASIVDQSRARRRAAGVHRRNIKKTGPPISQLRLQMLWVRRIAMNRPAPPSETAP